jgi:hypothetical protein
MFIYFIVFYVTYIYIIYKISMRILCSWFLHSPNSGKKLYQYGQSVADLDFNFERVCKITGTRVQTQGSHTWQSAALLRLGRYHVRVLSRRVLCYCAYSTDLDVRLLQVWGPFEKFVNWQQCATVMQRDAVIVMLSCSGRGNLVVAWTSSI